MEIIKYVFEHLLIKQADCWQKFESPLLILM